MPNEKGKGATLPPVSRTVGWARVTWDWLISVLSETIRDVEVGPGLTASKPRDPRVIRIELGGDPDTEEQAGDDTGNETPPGTGSLGCYEKIESIDIVCNSDGTIDANLNVQTAPVEPCGGEGAADAGVNIDP
jgi:hypothetical protein